MNLKLTGFIGLFLLLLSNISTAAPTPKACGELMIETNKSIELLENLNQKYPRDIVDTDLITQLQKHLDNLKTAIAQAPNNMSAEIAQSCSSELVNIQKMNRDLNTKLTK